ncbi:unnamed protein product, partial [Macrosiphum euphorbiae]
GPAYICPETGPGVLDPDSGIVNRSVGPSVTTNGLLSPSVVFYSASLMQNPRKVSN